MSKTVKVIVEGGKATPAPPLGPALGPLGVNIGQVVAEINAKTNHFNGMKVPVIVTVDPKTRKFELTVGTPPTSALLLGALNKEKGAQNPKTENIGSLKFEDIIEIAKKKTHDMLSSSLKNASKEVLGTCRSMGITVENKSLKEVVKEIHQGNYDTYFK